MGSTFAWVVMVWLQNVAEINYGEQLIFSIFFFDFFSFFCEYFGVWNVDRFFILLS